MTIESLAENLTYHNVPTVVYAADHNTAVIQNKHLARIAENLYLGRLVKEPYSDPEYPLYIAYAGAENLLAIRADTVRPFQTVEELTEKIRGNNLTTLEGYLAEKRRIHSEPHYAYNTEILFASRFDPAVAEKMAASKAEYLRLREERDRKRAEEIEREARERRAAATAQTEDLIRAALQTIRSGNGEIENKSITWYEDTDGKTEEHWDTVFRYLFRQYGIRLPLRTEGFVCNHLAKVSFRNGVRSGVWCRGGKSQAVFGYLDQLFAAIRAGQIA